MVRFKSDLKSDSLPACPGKMPISANLTARQVGENASLLAFEAKLWSAAACYRFGPSQLAGGQSSSCVKFPQASLRGGKR
jgi:hypothetical protein